MKDGDLNIIMFIIMVIMTSVFIAIALGWALGMATFFGFISCAGMRNL